jgi:hypothetical protein
MRIAHLLRLMAFSTPLSTARFSSERFLRPQDSKFSLPYVQTAFKEKKEFKILI